MNKRKILTFISTIIFIAILIVILENQTNCIFFISFWEKDSNCKIKFQSQINELPKLTITEFYNLSDDEITKLLTTILNDHITDEILNENESMSFITEKGDFQIKRNSQGKLEHISYNLLEENTISENDIVKFTNNLIKQIGFVQDGSEIIYEFTRSDVFGVQIVQSRDNAKWYDKGLQVKTYDDKTIISIGKWYQNLESAEFIDKDKAKQIAFEFVTSFDVKRNIKLLTCGFQPTISSEEKIKLVIMQDVYFYLVYGGICNFSEGNESHKSYYNVVIDAVEGRPLGLIPALIL